MYVKKNRASKKSKSGHNLKRIALLLESGMAFDRAIARGVGDYIRSKSNWIILMDPMMEVTMESLLHWKPDGIITSIHLPEINEIATLKDIPKIGFGSYSKELNGHLKFPIVTSNQTQIGAVAAEHFISNGMQHFAFCGGDETAPWCQQRRDGFVEKLALHDYKCIEYIPDFKLAMNMPEAISSLSKWLESLPKPTGVFVFFDGWARWVLDACVVQGIQVPQEISVLGVDNDRWLCELSQPMLSSIDANARYAGYKTAELLDEFMFGETSTPPLTHIEPSNVAIRDSSKYLNFDDPEVAFALCYINEHACDPITTADVLTVIDMSNSTAYRKFMKTIGRSIHNEIQRVQMNRVKELLITTNLNVSMIASRAGYQNVRYLTQVFRDITGQTPTEYRRTKSSPEVVR
jgi:LacI family transcriptional regulator|tara:strand:+ start:4272 stop:5486 length:1215 start_codon:yes stop_codon:yes gene_type:complete